MDTVQYKDARRHKQPTTILIANRRKPRAATPISLCTLLFSFEQKYQPQKKTICCKTIMPPSSLGDRYMFQAYSSVCLRALATPAALLQPAAGHTATFDSQHSPLTGKAAVPYAAARCGWRRPAGPGCAPPRTTAPSWGGGGVITESRWQHNGARQRRWWAEAF